MCWMEDSESCSFKKQEHFQIQPQTFPCSAYFSAEDLMQESCSTDEGAKIFPVTTSRSCMQPPKAKTDV